MNLGLKKEKITKINIRQLREYVVNTVYLNTITLFLSFVFIVMFFQILAFDEEILVFVCLFSVFLILVLLLKDVLITYFDSEMNSILLKLLDKIYKYRCIVLFNILLLVQYVKILDLILNIYLLLKVKIKFLVIKNKNNFKFVYKYIFYEYLKFLLKEEILIWKLLYIFNIKRKFLFIKLFFKLKFLNYNNLKLITNKVKNNHNLIYYLYESFYLLNLKNKKLS
jgi:hypothetical protein